MSEERKTERIQVRLPHPMEVSDARAYPAEVMRAVAEAANNAGLAGKRIDGITFENHPRQAMPELEFEVSQLKSTYGIGFEYRPGEPFRGGFEDEACLDRFIQEMARSLRESLLIYAKPPLLASGGRVAMQFTVEDLTADPLEGGIGSQMLAPHD